jgi:transcription elongation factor GreA-like protein
VVRFYLKSRYAPAFTRKDLMILRALIRRELRTLRSETPRLLRLLRFIFPWRPG